MADPKYFVPDSVVQDLKNTYKDNQSLINTVVDSLQSTGKVPEGFSGVASVIGNRVKPFREGVLEDLNINPSETLSEEGLQARIKNLQTLGGEDQTRTAVDLVRMEADITQYVLKRLGELQTQNVPISAVQQGASFAAANIAVGGYNPQAFAEVISNSSAGAVFGRDFDTLKAIANEVGSVFPQTLPAYNTQVKYKQDFSGGIKQINTILAEKQKATQEQRRIQEQQMLAEAQRGKSDVLFNQALQALNTQVPQFSPELSEGVLQNLQNTILGQGRSALSNVQAAAERRGITGSSIEAFQTAETEGQIANSLANATLQFLVQSGSAGQANREFLANSLFKAAQTYLGAGQGTEQLVTGREITGNELDLRRTQLAEQIRQFGTQIAESRRQFDEQMGFNKTQAADNIRLLLQQLGQEKPRNPLGVGMSSAALGAGLGALLAAPTGGLSLGAGAAIGAGAGGLGGGLLESFLPR